MAYDLLIKNGRIIDGSGKDWDEAWGHARRA